MIPIDRSTLPKPGPVVPFRFPEIDRSTLANGVRVWTVEASRLPLVACTILVRHGAATDARGREGLACLTADMLDEGSGPRSASDIFEAFARIGARLETDVTADSTILTLTTLSRCAPVAIRLLGDVIVRPALREADFERVRAIHLHRRRQQLRAPATLADECLLRSLYGDHPYGHTPPGSEVALAGLDVDDVRVQHSRAFRPDETTLIVVGDYDHRAVDDAAQDAFSSWSATGPPPQDLPPVSSTVHRLAIVPLAGARQSEVRVGTLGAPRRTASHTALQVGNLILGGQFVSRINAHLRQRKGLTYGAYSSFDYRRERGPFVVRSAVRSDGAGVAVTAILEEVAAVLGPRPIEREEFANAISAATCGYAREFESVEQIARGVAELALHDLQADEFSEFVPRAERLTPEAVGQQLAMYIDASQMTAVIVGDLEAFGGTLDGVGLGEPSILSREGALASAVGSVG